MSINSKPDFDSSRSYGKRLENPKPVASRELFLPENEIKAIFAVNFPKKASRVWSPRNKPCIQLKACNSYALQFFSYALLHMNAINCKKLYGHLIGTYSKCQKY